MMSYRRYLPSNEYRLQANNDGAILRTHVMRPPWHFVMPANIR